MSIVVKKIRGRGYAYLAYRSGSRVVQRYLGPVDKPEVVASMKRLEPESTIPERFQSLFWDVDPSSVDLRENARYVIERVLELGGIDALRWIQDIYPTRQIVETCEASRKLSPRSRNFWRIWFGYAS